MERYVATQFYRADSPESRILRESGMVPSEFVLAADAQATIAALQARVKELEEITKVICGHCCEPMEIPSKAVLQSALTQRTAELEAAKADKAKWEDIAGLRFAGDHKFVKEMELLKVENANLQAELERVRALVKALPKVEGEILEQGDFAFVRYAHADEPLPEIPRCNQIALLQHRKRMEE